MSRSQALVSMVTKKIAGSIVSLLVREAQKVSAIEAETDASTSSADNPYLAHITEGGPFYKHIEATLQKYFELFGEESPRGDGS